MLATTIAAGLDERCSATLLEIQRAATPEPGERDVVDWGLAERVAGR